MIAPPRGRARAAPAADFPRETNDLEEPERELSEHLLEAARRAGFSAAGGGGTDLSGYLSLRAANDRLRERGAGALLGAFTALAGEANRRGAGVTLGRTEPHRFRVGNSTMVGTRLTLSRGVRSLAVEAGWPRAPRDGFVQGGGLARARVTHFGDRGAGEDLMLVLDVGGTPVWVVPGAGSAHAELTPERLCRHVIRLLSEK